MSNNISIKIDGKEYSAKEGEYILNIARANGVFVPALCYLTGCSPTLACRICLVEADGKQVYSCNTKAKDGMEISTSTENIETERTAIMEVYDVNHPLQCGVCDQSGECELQQYTFYQKIDAQHYSIADTARETKDWGHLKYDPGLCIVCEKCVTVCKDMVGDAALKTIPRGGEALSKELKDEMPKDAYAMWNKLQKSVIGAVAENDILDCTACGECQNVCPTGALISSDFQYKANAWELTSIPATCSHCSNGCSLNYDVKHIDAENSEKMIYRTSNEYHYTSLCGAGRYGFDFENRDAIKDETKFAKAVEAFENAGTIKFNSLITNEEALILQKLKELKGYKLINDEALSFKKFMKSYGSVTGSYLYSGSTKDTHNSDFIVSVGSALKSDSPITRFAFNNALTMNKGAGLYFHPIGDPVIEGMSKNISVINHAPLKEETILYLLLDLFAKESLPEETKEYIKSFHETRTKTIEETIKEEIVEIVKNEETGEEEEKKKLVPKKITKEIEVDFSRLVEMVGLDLEFYDTLAKYLDKKEKFTLILGEDVINHPSSENIARLAGMINEHTDFDVVIIPPRTNSLGVSLICDLDEEASGKVIGYNEDGDFILSSLGNASDKANALDMPALNQQEGTFTNIDKRVVPTNAALPYKGYELNDIANVLGLRAENTIDYTKELGKIAGYKEEEFDNLPNYYTNSGEEVRGYVLEDVKVRRGGKLKEIGEIREFNGTVVYSCNPVKQFNQFTAKTSQLKANGALFVSETSAYKDFSKVEISKDGNSIVLPVEIDNKITGDIAYIPTFDKSINSAAIFSGYRFEEVNIKEVK